MRKEFYYRIENFYLTDFNLTGIDIHPPDIIIFL